MALQTLEGDLIPMRPAKETLTRYAVLLLGAAILSFGLFNVHSQSGVTEGGVLGTTLLLHHWFGISPGVSEFVIDVICYALGFRFLGKAFFKYAIAASAGFACFYMLWERVGPVLPDLSGQPLIAALLGGVFVGVGVGLVVRAGGASGGDDVLALLLNKFTKLTLSKSYFGRAHRILIHYGDAVLVPHRAHPAYRRAVRGGGAGSIGRKTKNGRGLLTASIFG